MLPLNPSAMTSTKLLRLLLLACGTGYSAIAFAADPAGSARRKDLWDHIYEYLPAIIIGAVILYAVNAIVRVLSLLLDNQRLRLMREHGIAPVPAAVAARESWWKRQYDKWTAAVPVERERDILLDHDYDGIHELDNSLPPWWLAIFYVTVVFAPIYVYYIHFSDAGTSIEEAYVLEMESAERRVKAYLARQADAVDENNLPILTDNEALLFGQSSYNANCLPCHGGAGEGGVGPNLTDKYWLHGGDINAIFKTIKYGVPEKGMIAWKSQLSTSEMHRISSFILTLQGTNPPNAKEAQGERVIAAPVPDTERGSSPTDGSLGMAN